jgi:hypothetical protein
MLLLSNIEERSWNHFCSGKATRIIYSEGVFVAVGIHDVMRVRHMTFVVRLALKYFLTQSHTQISMQDEVTV